MAVTITTTTASPAVSGNGLTLLQLKKAVRHALGNQSLAADTSEVEIINDAIQMLANAHPWTWRQKAMSLSLVASQNHVYLPSDFGRFHALARSASYYAMHPATMPEIISMRSTTGVATGATWYAVSYASQTSTSTYPRAKLEIYPTPSASLTAAIIGTYLKIIPNLNSDTDTPDIPAAFHVLLRKLVRAHALTEDNQDSGIMEMQTYETMLSRFIAEDAGTQSNLGSINGAVECRSLSEHDRLRPTSITL